MDRKEFQTWLSVAKTLTETRKAKAMEVLVERPSEAAALAAIELGVGEDRRCPHCDTAGAVARGYARGLRRYQCKGCGKTFGALTGTPLSGLHHKERWLDFGQSLAAGETVSESAERCDVAVSTAFRWRHRFLGTVNAGAEKLRGIVEADETFVLVSRIGERHLDRKPRKRGGKAQKRGLSHEQVPILVAADRSGATVSAVLPTVSADALRDVLGPVIEKDAILVSDGCPSYSHCAAALGISHQAINLSAGERIRGDMHIQTVNSRHKQIKTFLRRHRGVATKYLDHYLRWFHLAVRPGRPTPRTCLNAAMGG